jgi:hypothetical protein
MEEAEIVRIAKQTIDSAFFVGITEKFDLSVKLLFEKAGIPSPLEFLKLNEGISRKRDFSMTPEIASAIEGNSRLDREVYEFALSRLANILAGSQ